MVICFYSGTPNRSFREIIFSEGVFRVYRGVKTCEVFRCFVAIVTARVHYVDGFVFFVLRDSGSYTEDELLFESRVKVSKETVVLRRWG